MAVPPKHPDGRAQPNAPSGQKGSGNPSGKNRPVADDETPKRSSNIGQAFNRFILAHPALHIHSDAIWQYAEDYGIDPVYLASVLFHESKGIHSTKRNATGDSGIAQINDATWLNKKLDGKIITEKDLADPRFQIRLASFIIRQGLDNGLTYDNVYWADSPFAYNSGAGPKDKGPQDFVPKDYVFRGWSGGSGVPGGGGDPGADQDVQKANAADPYVVGVNSKGQLVTFKGSVPPPPKFKKKADGTQGDQISGVLMVDGRPIRRSEFLQIKRMWEDVFVSYTTGRPKNGQILNIIKNGWGEYTVLSLLTGGKNFTKSPIYKSKFPGYAAAAKNLLGPGEKLDPKLVSKAILNGWDISVLQAELRKGKKYTESIEFKGTAATMSMVYSSIYGTPGSGGMGIVKEAALAGWSPDQFASWLRSRDEYVYTPEYRRKATSLVEALGFMTGKVATLQPTPFVPPPPGTPTGFGPLPDDPRIKNGQLPDDGGLVPGVQR